MFSLKAMFGKEVRVTYDPSYYVEKNKSKEDEMWLEEIVGKRGTVYPQSETHVSVDCTLKTGRVLLALFGDKAAKHRECDEGMSVVIPLDLVRSTFRYIKPRKRRQLSEAQKAVATARLAAFRTQSRPTS